jgi:acetyl esterase/lipase
MTCRIVFVAICCLVTSGERFVFAADPTQHAPNHHDLSHFIDDARRPQPIKSVADWELRRKSVNAGMQTVMGSLPGESFRVPLDVKLIDEQRVGKLTRRRISFQADPTDRVTAFLFLPPLEGRKAAAVLCLQQTTQIGKDEPAGVGGDPNLHYALHLAERGFITLAPDYPSFGEHAYDFAPRHGYVSGSMKAIWDNIRAVDYLQSLIEVDPARIGVIGHSLGGHNAMFTAAFDPRLKVIVSSCGFTRFHRDDMPSWTGPRYMPRIASEFKNDPDRMPFDFPEIIASFAPRPFLTCSATRDDDFDVVGVRESLAAAKPIYDLYPSLPSPPRGRGAGGEGAERSQHLQFAATSHLNGYYPDAPHSFPADARDIAYRFLETHLAQAGVRVAGVEHSEPPARTAGGSAEPRPQPPIAQAQPAADKPLVKTTHVFKTVGDVKVEADVYRPEGDEARPVVVWIHGGALIVGGRAQVPKNILDLCTRERFILVSLDYRLAPEVKLPEIAGDIQDAFRWLHERGPKLFHADTSRIVVTGGSAGGFLTMLTGVIVKPKPTALVAYWGYPDIDNEWARAKSTHHGAPVDREEALAGVNRGVVTNTHDPAVGKARGNYYRYLRQTGGWARDVTGFDPVAQADKLRPFCPIHNLTRDYPPILMIHGTADTDVPYSCSADLARELSRLEVPHELITIKGAEHGLRDGDPQAVAQAHQRALVFIREHLDRSRHSPSADGRSRRERATLPDDIAALLAAIGRTGPGGTGSDEARAASAKLAKRGVEILPQLFETMDTDNPVAANWGRAIYEDIVAREFKRSDVTWPTPFLKEYVRGAKRAGRARRLALSLLDRIEPEFGSTLLPTLLDDPEFRRDAVDAALSAGEKAQQAKDDGAATVEFRKAFEHARDSGQVSRAAAKLQSLGETADVIGHLGLVVDWWIVGPFDAPEKTGFATVFEPERSVDLQAKYKGQSGEIGWKRTVAADALGQLNLITALGATREAVGYVFTTIDVPAETAAELRCGADDNCSVWLNGRKVFSRDQWLNGTRFDRFVTPIRLAAGRNSLLVKVCQGPQHKDPEVPNNWSLQLRLCDPQGKGIAFRSALPPVEPGK